MRAKRNTQSGWSRSAAVITTKTKSPLVMSKEEKDEFLWWSTWIAVFAGTVMMMKAAQKTTDTENPTNVWGWVTKLTQMMTTPDAKGMAIDVAGWFGLDYSEYNGDTTDKTTTTPPTMADVINNALVKEDAFIVIVAAGTASALTHSIYKTKMMEHLFDGLGAAVGGTTGNLAGMLP